MESVVRINNGSVDVINFGTKSLLEVIEIVNNANAVEDFGQTDGITIDESKLSTSQLRLILKTIKPLKDGEAILAQEGRDRLKRLHLELFTLSEELFEYDQWVDLASQGVNISAPARKAANIENASGVFGGASRVTTFLDIN